MKTVYILQHSYEVGEDGDYDEVKVIGIYSSREKAEQVMEQYKRLPGFKNHPIDCFYIGAHKLDKNNWTEGFVKIYREN